MPIFDFRCNQCDSICEEYVHDYRIPSVLCRICKKGIAFKQFSFRSAYKEDASWIPSVLDVVDKDSKAPHVRKFLETPNRTNWLNWMKEEHIRPLENNERIKVQPVNLDSIVKDVYEHLRDSNKIEI